MRRRLAPFKQARIRVGFREMDILNRLLQGNQPLAGPQRDGQIVAQLSGVFIQQPLHKSLAISQGLIWTERTRDG